MTEHPTILVIEDDREVREAISTALEDHGYSVIAAENGAEGIDELRRASEPPGLILLDLSMPVMDGWQFRAAQRRTPAVADVPVVLLSGNVDTHEAAEELEAETWLKKPIDMTALLKVIERSCA